MKDKYSAAVAASVQKYTGWNKEHLTVKPLMLHYTTLDILYTTPLRYGSITDYGWSYSIATKIYKPGRLIVSLLSLTYTLSKYQVQVQSLLTGNSSLVLVVLTTIIRLCTSNNYGINCCGQHYFEAEKGDIGHL